VKEKAGALAEEIMMKKAGMERGAREAISEAEAADSAEEEALAAEAAEEAGVHSVAEEDLEAEAEAGLAAGAKEDIKVCLYPTSVQNIL
jgi:hypothetical protein